MDFIRKPKAPFRLDLTSWALRRLPGNIIDRFQNGEYKRAIVLENQTVEISVSQLNISQSGALRVHVAAEKSSSDLKSSVNSLLDRLLGLDIDLGGFYRLVNQDPKLRDLAEKFMGVKPPRFPTVFEALVNAFACQQVSLNVGLLLLNRLAQNYGAFLKFKDERVYSFPTPDRLATLSVQELRRLGFSNRKSEYIIETAKLIAKGKANLENIVEMDRREAIDLLMQIKGVGRWTAEYALLRGAGRLDVFPADDAGGQNSLRSWLRLRQKLDYDKVTRIISHMQPYAGMLYFHLLLQKIQNNGHLN